MKKVISTEKIPIKMWLNDIEEDTLKQAKHLANKDKMQLHPVTREWIEIQLGIGG